MKAGDRVELIKMVDEPDAVPPGSQGTIVFIDDAGTLDVDWDNGRCLGLIPGEDQFKIIDTR